MKIVCVGNLNQDITLFMKRYPRKHEKIEAQNILISNGGSSANTACWLSKSRIQTIVLGSVGDDSAGRAQIKELRSYGVKTTHIRVSELSTGRAIIMQTSTDKRMIKHAGANTEIRLNKKLLRNARWVHASSMNKELRNELFNYCYDNNIILSYDPGSNTPSRKELKMIKYLFINEDELRRITKRLNIVDSARKCGAENVLVGLNNGGAIFVNKDFMVSIPKIKINDFVDGTGAGDAGNAGFIYGILKGKKIIDAVKLKVILSNYKIGFEGARTGIKNIKFFYKYLKK